VHTNARDDGLNSAECVGWWLVRLIPDLRACRVPHPARPPRIPLLNLSGERDQDGVICFFDPAVAELVVSVVGLGLLPPTSADVNNTNIATVGPLVRQFLVARLVLLHVIRSVDHIPGTASAFFFVQRTNWGRDLCASVCRLLRTWDPSRVDKLCEHLFASTKPGECVLALDEAGVPAVDLFPTLFKSSADLSVSRGLLGPILAAVPHSMAVVVAGTTLRLPEVVALGSGLLKGVGMRSLVQFPTMRSVQAGCLLLQFLCLDGASAAEAEEVARLLAGKGRYLEHFFNCIMDPSRTRPATGTGLVSLAREVRELSVSHGVTKLTQALGQGMPGSLPLVFRPLPFWSPVCPFHAPCRRAAP
jgi:hypothetical protein